MFARFFSILALSALFVGCGGGPPSPPGLAFDLPSPSEVSYHVGDTTSVSVSMMGQRLALSLEGVIDYGVVFETTPGGIVVKLTVEELAATINQPMGAPLRLDRSDASGELVFTLDRRGNATISESLVVSDAASQMVSSLGLAHTFFPGLPGRAVSAGDSWADTVSYEGDEGPGMRSEHSVTHYTVVGDTVIDGRSLLVISLQGTSESTTQMELAGMAISQASTVEVSGHVLWDLRQGIMFESVKTGTGSGTVRVPVAPAPLPIAITSTKRIQLRGM